MIIPFSEGGQIVHVEISEGDTKFFFQLQCHHNISAFGSPKCQNVGDSQGKALFSSLLLRDASEVCGAN